eukprot:comp18156_c0_seq1/m.18927 comp18156_c0_seq1/g.18927  ORF comp18156_c0_seq1/g.18927 comp18156_c0_seq1/m.18927 type:complete len:175 (-) comp18156_c0_seq1:10-534(-)
MSVAYAELLQLSQQAQAQLQSVLAEAYLLFDLIKQFKLPAKAEEVSAPESDQGQGQRRASRRMSLLEGAREGGKGVEGDLPRLQQQLQAHTVAMERLKATVNRINEMCAKADYWPPDIHKQEVSPEDAKEFESLTRRRDELALMLAGQNRALRKAMEDMRDLNMMVAVVSAKTT